MGKKTDICQPNNTAVIINTINTANMWHGRVGFGDGPGWKVGQSGE